MATAQFNGILDTENWQPLILEEVASYFVGRGFYIFEFISKEEHNMIFRSGPYLIGPNGLYLNKWTLNFDPSHDIPWAVLVWVRLLHLIVH